MLKNPALKSFLRKHKYVKTSVIGIGAATILFLLLPSTQVEKDEGGQSVSAVNNEVIQQPEKQEEITSERSNEDLLDPESKPIVYEGRLSSDLGGLTDLESKAKELYVQNNGEQFEVNKINNNMSEEEKMKYIFSNGFDHNQRSELLRKNQEISKTPNERRVHSELMAMNLTITAKERFDKNQEEERVVLVEAKKEELNKRTLKPVQVTLGNMLLVNMKAGTGAYKEYYAAEMWEGENALMGYKVFD